MHDAAGTTEAPDCGEPDGTDGLGGADGADDADDGGETAPTATVGRTTAGPRPALLSMRWEDVLFAHWPVAPATVERRLPRGLSVDTHDGRAYLGIVPFVMAEIRPRFAPVALSFGELNLRTYVRDAAGEPGVYFFSLDADDRVGAALARRLFRLPYYAAAIDARPSGSGADREVRFHARRPGGAGGDDALGAGPDAPAVRFEATYGPSGPTRAPAPGSLAAFLTERYRFYADGRRALYRGEIDHEPWPLAPANATIRPGGLFAVNGFDRPDGGPIVHYCRSIRVEAGRPRRA